jgi:hypothetical protein
MKKAVVTTFHEAGYSSYGKRMIKTFLENWPKDITLYVYPEDHKVEEVANNLIVRDLHSSCPDLVAFKNKWKNDPKASGRLVTPEFKPQEARDGYAFRWDAVRFSNKVYAVCHAAANCDADVLYWMDADMVCHSPIPHHFIDKMSDQTIGLGFLGRPKKFTECGLYSMNLKDKNTQEFLVEFKKAYDTDRLFGFAEFNDCWVFDEVRKEVKARHPEWKWNDWCLNLGDLRASPLNSIGEGHPLINSAWGAYLDHLKGKRKDTGKSNRKDLKVVRSEKYWTTLR